MNHETLFLWFPFQEKFTVVRTTAVDIDVAARTAYFGQLKKKLKAIEAQAVAVAETTL